jgi:glutamate-1-semialdehyde 2,1-aminomutase
MSLYAPVANQDGEQGMNEPRRKPRSDYERHLLAKAAELLPAGARNPTMSAELAMIVREAHGSRIVDESGNEYIDYLLGSGPMLLGHTHPRIVAAVRDQLELGSSYLLVSQPTVALAERLVAAVPCAERISFCNSGTEAVYYALRLARAYRGRDKILKFEGAYHGQCDWVLMSNQWTWKPADPPTPVPNSLGIPRSVESEVLVAPFNDLETTAALIDEHCDDLAAVLVEPLHRTIPPAEGFLPGLHELTAGNGVPLIFDEVVTGFRLGYGGAQEYYGVTPDLCALGKSISAGHPIGVVAGRADIMAHADAARQLGSGHVSITGTYSGNPISCAAALASLDELSKDGVYERLFERGRRLMTGIQTLLDEVGLAAHVCGEPPVFEVWFAPEPPYDFRGMLGSDFGMRARFAAALLERGVMKAHEKFFVSTAHDDDDIARTLEACRGAVAELAG